jgi:SRSO17 transposase
MAHPVPHRPRPAARDPRAHLTARVADEHDRRETLGVSLPAHARSPAPRWPQLAPPGRPDPARHVKSKRHPKARAPPTPDQRHYLNSGPQRWIEAKAPVLGDQAYGENTKLRDRLDGAECEYVLSVGPTVTVFGSQTVFAVPSNEGAKGRHHTRPRPDRQPESISELLNRIGPDSAQSVTFRDGPDGEPITARFVFARVRAAHHWDTYQRKWAKGGQIPPREEWLIAQWPAGREQPTDYWISNLSADTEPEQLARLARMRWKIELDYKQLKGELGLDHYEGRSWLGWYHHTALVTAAHGFLTLERQHPNPPRPA